MSSRDLKAVPQAPVARDRPLYPVFCRGHSGGRILCEAFIRNGVDMGRVAPDRKDTEWFAPVGNPAVERLAEAGFQYPELPDADQAAWQRETVECINNYVRDDIRGGGPFGWKMGVTLFMMPMVLDAFPEARVIHLIRDGRDVMLSRLDARMDFSSRLNRRVVFGDPDTDRWRGRPLTAETVAAHRNEIEMQHWVTSVEFGLRCRAYGDRYLEVRYEDICRSPVPEFERIFAFLQLPFRADARDWLGQSVSTDRMGKWRDLPARNVASAFAIGADLLKRLGYA